MLNLLSADDSSRLRAWFEETGYTETSLRKHLGAAELPSRHLRNHARLLDRTSAPLALNVLLRWFWLALPQTRKEAEDLIPGDILSLMLQSGDPPTPPSTWEQGAAFSAWAPPGSAMRWWPPI